MHSIDKLKILHITPHFGGGVGTVVLNYLKEASKSKEQNHTIVSLDYINDYAIKELIDANIEHYGPCQDLDLINQLIFDSDILFVHWWNHPLLTNFLVRHHLPKCRLIFWAHISGDPMPNNFNYKVINYPDAFVFTTPMSFHNEIIKDLVSKGDKFPVIWSTGGSERLIDLRRPKEIKDNESFVVGYVGNLDFTKISTDIIEIFEGVNIPNAHFYIVGGPNNLDLINKANSSPIRERITLTGYVSEERKWELLSKFDVFAYPLARHHYATCDQAIQEAMAFGAIPVVYDNLMETYMVKDGDTGLVANTKDDFISRLRLLHGDCGLRRKLSNQAQAYAKKEWSIKKMVSEWNKIFDDVLKIDKKERVWSPYQSLLGQTVSSAHVFAESMPNESSPFVLYLAASTERDRQKAAKEIAAFKGSKTMTSKTKSSPYQFRHFLGQSEALNIWCDLIGTRN